MTDLTSRKVDPARRAVYDGVAQFWDHLARRSGEYAMARHYEGKPSPFSYRII